MFEKVTIITLLYLTSMGDIKQHSFEIFESCDADILFNVVKSLRYGASVACCGLTAGVGFKGSVLPFILRGVNLLGVDSVELPLVVKASMWDKLSLQWKVKLDALVHEVTLEQTPDAIAQLLAGQQVGRVLVNLG